MERERRNGGTDARLPRKWDVDCQIFANRSPSSGPVALVTGFRSLFILVAGLYLVALLLARRCPFLADAQLVDERGQADHQYSAIARQAVPRRSGDVDPFRGQGMSHSSKQVTGSPDGIPERILVDDFHPFAMHRGVSPPVEVDEP